MHKRGVMLVDDDPQINLLIANWLSDEKIPCFCVGTTAEGEASIALRLPSVVIVDMGMVKPPTVEFCHNLRTTPRTSEIPILVITGKTVDEAREIADIIEKFGNPQVPVDYLIKPFTMNVLKAKLASLSTPTPESKGT